MSSPKNIIWLASYPKSGNTWIRILLSNYLNQEESPININKINASIISSSRSIFDDYIPFLSSDLSLEEIDIIRPEVYKMISSESQELRYIKTHDAYTTNKDEKNIFPKEVSKAVIQIVRNPLDIAVSFAHHSNISIEKSILNLNNNNLAFSSSSTRLTTQLRQKLLSWSNHYLSWKEAKIPSLIIKYEDLLKNTELEFRKIILFIYGEVDEAKLKKAVQDSSFSKLQQQENKQEFKEKPIDAKSFFRKGIAGSWKKDLTDEQVLTIINTNKEVMLELGYISN